MKTFIHILFGLVVSLILAATPAHAQQPAGKLESTLTEPDSDIMELVGLLASTHLYQTYLNIGFIADARSDETLTTAEAEEVLQSVIIPLEKIDTKLDKLAKRLKKKDDLAALDDLRKISALLRREASELKAFWATEKAADGDKYEATRKDAWKRLSKLLMLE